MKNHYVKNADLLRELKISKDRGALTMTAIEMCMKMNTEIHTKKLRYVNQEDREDCMAGAIADVFAYWTNFNPEYNGDQTNAFAYITQILKNGSAKSYNKMHPKAMKKSISIDTLFDMV
jgi:hypothetical protein